MQTRQEKAQSLAVPCLDVSFVALSEEALQSFVFEPDDDIASVTDGVTGCKAQRPSSPAAMKHSGIAVR